MIISNYLLRLFLPLLVSASLNAQSVLQGEVKAVDNHLISKASVVYLHHSTGCYTDTNGKFSIQKIIGDTIQVSFVGYQPVSFMVQDKTDFLQVTLVQEEKELDGVSVSTKKMKTVSLGYYTAHDKFIISIRGNGEYGVLIPNKLQTSGFITEIKFRLTDYKNSKYNLRVKLLGVDTVTGLPSDSLSLFVKDIPAIGLQKVNKISIPNNYIHLPSEGVVVALQWIAIDSLNAHPVYTPWITGNKTLEERRIFRRIAKENGEEESWVNRNVEFTKKKSEIILYVPNISIEAVIPVVR